VTGFALLADFALIWIGAAALAVLRAFAAVFTVEPFLGLAVAGGGWATRAFVSTFWVAVGVVVVFWAYLTGSWCSILIF
jgi:hypothetical protein